MCVKLGHAKFHPSSARGTVSNWGLNGGGRKMYIFQWKTGHISETVKDTTKVTISH